MNRIFLVAAGVGGEEFPHLVTTTVPRVAEPIREQSSRHYDSVISRMIRHGFPAANTQSGMSLVTTLPAPITVFEPIFTPGQMIAPPPTHTSDPISIGLPNSW